MDNGVENLSRQQHNTLEHQHKVTNEFYNTTGGVDDCFKPKYRQHTRPLIDNDIPTSIHRQPEFGKRAYDRDGIRKFHWEQKDEYEVYRDDHGHARGVDGHIIHVSKDDIRNLLERAPMDEQSYICLPEHAREIVEIQRYSTSHPEASTSINRGIQISINEATPTDRGQLVTKKIENTTATMKDKWRRGGEAMRDFTDSEDRVGVEEDVNFVSGTGFQRSGNQRSGNQSGNGNFYGNRQRSNFT
ncbi:hypothetical protein F2Q69_00029393 [Brassica cretica]|uniref:Uncharacterized protein n=1 Tax=Brassica cretica TaxID=69181 RepID=A0A8S9S809_BRACR|nr:hypothetical protein F2Q69_00029393 [Brassica cretica]